MIRPEVDKPEGAEPGRLRRAANLLLKPASGLSAQFLRYLVVGGIAFGVDFGTLYVLTAFIGLHYLASAAVAFLLGLATNYALSRSWVFDRRSLKDPIVEFAVFSAIGVVGLAMNEVVMWLACERLHLHYLIAKVISAAIVLVWNFGARKAMLFSARPLPGLTWLVMRWRGWIPSLAAAALFFAICLAIQGTTGAWQAPFAGYPDEPAHFVGSAMVRDWLASGRYTSPLAFARDYYAHYPSFAVGYWPPLFYLITGFWLLVVGVGRTQALMIPAVFAAGTAWLMFRLVRERAGIVAGLCAGAVYVSFPAAQRWLCQVMVDHMSAFLSLATAASVMSFLRRPVLWRGVVCGLCVGCAILTKFSASYTLALSFAAILALRRFALLRRPGFLLHLAIVVVMVGPWVLWTGKLAYYGLLSYRVEPSWARAASFMQELIGLFPTGLLVLVVVGLLAMLLRASEWPEGLAVLGLMAAGNLAFLILSPVAAEPRHLFGPVAPLVALSIAGWFLMLNSALGSGRLARFVPVVAAGLAVMFLILEWGNYSRAPRVPIRQAVEAVLRHPARAVRGVVAPPNLELPVIAEFVAQDRHRPSYRLLRPSKILSRSDWFGRNYVSTFGTSEEMMDYFRRNPVGALMWNGRSGAAVRVHERLTDEMLRLHPLEWRKTASFPSAAGGPDWKVYEYVPAGS